MFGFKSKPRDKPPSISTTVNVGKATAVYRLKTGRREYGKSYEGVAWFDEALNIKMYHAKDRDIIKYSDRSCSFFELADGTYINKDLVERIEVVIEDQYIKLTND